MPPRGYSNSLDTVRYSRPYVKEEMKKPEREHVINDDDILNLKIALETSTSLEEFEALI